MPTEFYFSNVLLPTVTNVAIGLPSRSQGFLTPGRPGARAPRRIFADVRSITTQGAILNTPGQTFDDLEKAWAQFCSAIHMTVAGGVPGQLKLDDNWIWYAFPGTINDTETTYASKTYDITWMCYDPHRYSTTTGTTAGGTTNGSTATITSSSPVETPLTASFTVTTGGVVTFTDSVFGRSFSVNVTPGNWVIDGFMRTVTLAGIDSFNSVVPMSRFLSLPGVAAVGGTIDSIITTTLTGGAVLSANTFSARNRSL